jgi:hypothetical protein
MQIDERDEQFSNASSTTTESLEPGSNVIVRREVQSEKQQWARRSTYEGIQIDESDEQCPKAESPINES